MADGITFVGLDVHVATIAIAVCREDGIAQDLGQIRNEPSALAKRLRKLGSAETLRVCYEAGPCGYTIWRQLTGLGIACQVVAPSLIPVKPGDRIKTDRRDAAKLARLRRSGDLTPVAVPTPEQEALRDLSRLREAAVGDRHRARQRLVKFLVRHGISEPRGTRGTPSRWTQRYHRWLATLTLPLPTLQLVLDDLRTTVTTAEARVEQLTAALVAQTASGPFAATVAALQRLHGVGPVTAVGLVAEIGDLTRFDRPTQLMAYAGIVPREHSSGSRTQRGAITKTGNTHVRRLLVEAAWHYRRAAGTRPAPTTPVEEVAARARIRLQRRYGRLVSRGKVPQVAVVAVARELLGFIWAIAHEVQRPAADAA